MGRKSVNEYKLPIQWQQIPCAVVWSSSSCHESCLFYCCVDHSVDIYVGRERERESDTIEKKEKTYEMKHQSDDI